VDPGFRQQVDQTSQATWQQIEKDPVGSLKGALSAAAYSAAGWAGSMHEALTSGNGYRFGSAAADVTSVAATVVGGAGAVRSVACGLSGAGRALAADAGDVGAADSYIYRVSGGDARQMGHSWTSEDPSTMANPRDRLGPPDKNSGRWLNKGYVTDWTGVRSKAHGADPLDGNRGGGPELLVPDPSHQIWIVRSRRVAY
jgi:hypothetical protein